MPQFNIPKRFLPGFESIASELSDSQFEAIINAIDKLEEGFNEEQFTDAIGKSIDKAPSYSAIATTIYSIGNVQLHDKFNSVEFVKDITNQLSNSLEISFDQNIFRHRIDVLTKSIYRLKKTFKAALLCVQNENTISSSQIITDIRLIFDDQISSPNRLGVINHQLKLEFHYGDSISTKYFTFDKNDLITLRSLIDRAIEKDSLIRSDYPTIQFIDTF